MTYINRQRQYRSKGSAVGKVAVHLQGDLPRNDTTVARHIFPPHPEKRRQYQALSLLTKNSRTKEPPRHLVPFLVAYESGPPYVRS